MGKNGFRNWRLWVAAVIALCLLLAAADVEFGMSERAMKDEAMDRRPDGWDFTGTTGETMAAFLQYDGGKKTQFDCQVYVKRQGDFGWFFRYGASGTSVDGQQINDRPEAVTKLSVENNRNYALFSLNNIGITKMEIYRDGEMSIKNLEPGRPFALVLDHSWEVILYDGEGKRIVPLERNI